MADTKNWHDSLLQQAAHAFDSGKVRQHWGIAGRARRFRPPCKMRSSTGLSAIGCLFGQIGFCNLHQATMVLDDAHVEIGLATLLEEVHLSQLWCSDVISSEELQKEFSRLNPDKCGGLYDLHTAMLQQLGGEVIVNGHSNERLQHTIGWVVWPRNIKCQCFQSISKGLSCPYFRFPTLALNSLCFA